MNYLFYTRVYSALKRYISDES